MSFRLVRQALVNLKHGKARPAVGAGEFAFHALLFGDDHRSPTDDGPLGLGDVVVTAEISDV